MRSYNKKDSYNLLKIFNNNFCCIFISNSFSTIDNISPIPTLLSILYNIFSPKDG